MLERYKVPANAARVKSGRGEIVAWAVTPTLVVQVARGHGDARLAEGFLKEQDALLAGRRGVTVFFDGLAFTGYDSGFRTPLSASARALVDSGQLKRILLLTRSKLVAMGAAVVNLASSVRRSRSSQIPRSSIAGWSTSVGGRRSTVPGRPVRAS